MTQETPRRPSRISEYAEVCLQALVARGLGGAISLGGGLGLLHYLDYRTTHDVDAWWSEGCSQEDRRCVIRAVEEALASFGEVKTRAWGEVVSVELLREGRGSAERERHEELLGDGEACPERGRREREPTSHPSPKGRGGKRNRVPGRSEVRGKGHVECASA